MSKGSRTKRVRRNRPSPVVRRGGAHRKSDARVSVLSPRQLEALAERRAQAMLGLPAKKAFKLLEAGKLRGTIAEAELQMLRFLQG